MIQRRAVICDDHRTFGDALGSVLAGSGWQVRVVTSPASVGALLARESADVCIMDFRFPGGVDALEACRELLHAHPRLRILMLTGGIPADCVRRGLSIGITGFARKDQRVHQVLDAINRVAAGHAVIEPSILRGAAAPAVIATPPGHSLTPRERETLRHIVSGHGTRDIAREMGITYSTARTHVQNLLAKLGVHSRLEAASLAMRTRLVDLPSSTPSAPV